MVLNCVTSFMDDSLPKIEFIFTEDKVDENDAGSKVDENGDQGPKAAPILSTDLATND